MHLEFFWVCIFGSRDKKTDFVTLFWEEGQKDIAVYGVAHKSHRLRRQIAVVL
jgi:hypothetical protein